MSTARRIGEAVHVAALGVWLGALILAGAVAATVFPLMRDLDPTLAAYPGYDGPHWMLAAGKVADRGFFFADVVQFFGMTLALGTFILITLGRGAERRWSTFVRAAILLTLLGVLSYQFFVLNPRMQDNLHAYWLAAAAGDTPTAETHRQAFSADHPTASRVMGANAALVLAALVAAAASRTAPSHPRPE